MRKEKDHVRDVQQEIALATLLYAAGDAAVSRIISEGVIGASKARGDKMVPIQVVHTNMPLMQSQIMANEQMAEYHTLMRQAAGVLIENAGVGRQQGRVLIEDFMTKGIGDTLQRDLAKELGADIDAVLRGLV